MAWGSGVGGWVVTYTAHCFYFFSVQTWVSWQSPLTRWYFRELSESGIRADTTTSEWVEDLVTLPWGVSVWGFWRYASSVRRGAFQPNWGFWGNLGLAGFPDSVALVQGGGGEVQMNYPKNAVQKNAKKCKYVQKSAKKCNHKNAMTRQHNTQQCTTQCAPNVTLKLVMWF